MVIVSKLVQRGIIQQFLIQLKFVKNAIKIACHVTKEKHIIIY